MASDYGLLEVCSPQTPSLHVVLIHGLNGGRSSTWTNSKNEFWPAWIGRHVPGARVWVYGYNANLWYTGSNDHLVLHATKLLNILVDHQVGRLQDTIVPTVLVGHSLGGILIKQAILSATQPNQSFSYLAEAIKAVCFCGTPHRGSRWANRLFFLSLGNASAFVSLLQRRRPFGLSDIADKFNNHWERKPVLTFVETIGVPILGGSYIIVRAQDALTNCRSEERHDLQKDHRTIVRPESPGEVFFQNLIKYLQEQGGQGQATHAPVTDAITAPLSLTVDEISPRLRKVLYRQFCLGQVWHHRIYPSGDVEIGPDDHAAGITAESFEGGSFSYQWPPGTNTLINLVVDLTTSTFEWTIIAAQSVYYPGQHSGTIRIGRDYPSATRQPPRQHTVFPIWKSPILCPYVGYEGGMSAEDYDWWGMWQPGKGLEWLLNAFAAFLHFGPLRERMPQELYDDCITLHPVGVAAYLTSESWYRGATNFFCRAYTMSSMLDMIAAGHESELEDSDLTQVLMPATEEMCSGSISDIRGLLENMLDVSDPPSDLRPPHREEGTLEHWFTTQKFQTRRDWMLEERMWADALDAYFHVKKTRQ